MRRCDDATIYGQVFDARFFDGFDGFDGFDDESAESLAATIVANEIEPPHDGGVTTPPAPIDRADLPDEPVHWVS